MTKAGHAFAPPEGLWLLEEIHRLTEAVEARLAQEDWEKCSRLLEQRQALLDKVARQGGLPSLAAWPPSQREKAAALAQGLQQMEERIQAAWQASYEKRTRELSDIRTARRQLKGGMGRPAAAPSRHLDRQV